LSRAPEDHHHRYGRQARIDVRETFVFRTPRPGDLFDVCALDGETTFKRSSVSRQTRSISGTASRPQHDHHRKPKRRVPYAYDHQYSWSHGRSRPALCSEFRCEKRTGTYVFEMITPQEFEAAVAFPRPGWAHMRSERTLIKYALKQLEAGCQGPTIADNGQRAEWRIVGPRLGRRYVCVPQRHSVALW
jgi:hypothetical protein